MNRRRFLPFFPSSNYVACLRIVRLRQSFVLKSPATAGLLF